MIEGRPVLGTCYCWRQAIVGRGLLFEASYWRQAIIGGRPLLEAGPCWRQVLISCNFYGYYINITGLSPTGTCLYN